MFVQNENTIELLKSISSFQSFATFSTECNRLGFLRFGFQFVFDLVNDSEMCGIWGVVTGFRFAADIRPLRSSSILFIQLSCRQLYLC